jgi:hypothetical protein
MQYRRMFNLLNDLEKLDNNLQGQLLANQKLISLLENKYFEFSEYNYNNIWQKAHEIDRDIKVVRRQIDLLANSAYNFELDCGVPQTMIDCFIGVLSMTDQCDGKWSVFYKEVGQNICNKYSVH